MWIEIVLHYAFRNEPSGETVCLYSVHHIIQAFTSLLFLSSSLSPSLLLPHCMNVRILRFSSTSVSFISFAIQYILLPIRGLRLFYYYSPFRLRNEISTTRGFLAAGFVRFFLLFAFKLGISSWTSIRAWKDRTDIDNDIQCKAFHIKRKSEKKTK